MATIRRLSDTDVRGIFESLHGNTPPPPHLQFQIVPVGPNGLKLSPPSYEVEDGLYVLMKPEKKRKNAPSSNFPDRSKVPSHLMDHAIHMFPPETCPWSLSGPQFPQPTAIQQRYCYPKGDPVYSSRKGGALWTMYGRDGKEDLEFRLLHVYFSAKRAVNKGMNLSPGDRAMIAKHQQQSVASTPRKKRKTTTTSMTNNRSIRSPWQQEPQQQQQQQHFSPMSSCASSSRGGTNRNSPPLRSFDMPLLPPPSPCCSRDNENRRSIFVSPNTAASSSEHAHHDDDGVLFDHPFHPVPSFDASTVPKMSPFRMLHNHQFSDLFRNPEDTTRRRVTKDDDEEDCVVVFNDPDDMEDSESLVVDLDSYWNDPLFTLVMKPSMEQQTPPPEKHLDDPCKALGNRLQVLHQRIREGILEHPPTEQGRLVSMVANWARSIAKSPLEIQANKSGDAAVKKEATTAAV